MIKLFHPFIINCCRSQFTSMIKKTTDLKKTPTGRLTRNSLSGSELCPYCSPWYIISRRINPIELYNPSVADGLFLIANWIIWFIQALQFDVLLNCQHTNMLFLCMLHVKSTVSCFILVLEVTNYELLVDHILLIC